jgi:hypothetical protein
MSDRGLEEGVRQRSELALQLRIQVRIGPADEPGIELACLVVLAEDVVPGLARF